MKVVIRLVCFFFFILVFCSSTAAANSTAAPGSRNQNAAPSPRTETIFGMVVQVNLLREANPRDPVVEIRLQQGDRTATIRLGPSSFLNEYGFTLKEGEDITVRVRRDPSSTIEKTVFVGMEITKGSRRLTLRDDNGQPLW
jgi:hypothetical protein